MAFQKYDFKKVGLGKKASAFDTYRELAANKPSVQDIVAPQQTVKSTDVPSQDPLETPYTVGATGGSQPSQPVDDSWKDSLAGINSYYETGKPANGGTAEDMKNGVNHWQAYLDELDKFQAANGSNEDFDQTQFKLYRDYASNSLKNAQDSYAATLAQENAAQNSKMEQANMKEQALKYAQMSMDAQGLGSQGVNGSLQAGIGNQFAENSANIDKEKAEAQQSNFAQYQQMANDNKGRLEEELYNNEQNKKNEIFELASTMLESAENLDDIKKIKDAYYGKMSPEQQKTFDYYADIAARGMEQEQKVVTPQEASKDYFSQAEGMDVNSDEYKLTIGKANYNQMKTAGYYVQGFNNNGRKNNDIDITIGYNSRNKDHEFDLLLTGPASGIASANLDQICGQEKGEGTLALYDGKLYIYSTDDGWWEVGSDHDKIEDAIAEFKKYGTK